MKKDFIWGAATAAYQIEGAAYEDNKGLNVWDVLSKKPGFVKNGDTGEVACDHYHRYKEDVKLMKEIGINAYRFSFNWARILPGGVGEVNQKGLDFYDRLIDELLEAEITPYATIFHWDYPYELYKKGGWLNLDSSNWFAEYTKVLVDRFSDRVQNWFTLNEPQCFIILGHHAGEHAPGLQLQWEQVLLAGHNSIISHGKASKVIREFAKKPPKIAIAPIGSLSIPVSDSIEDIEAARSKTFSYNSKEVWNSTWWMDPIFFGKYPSDGVKQFEEHINFDIDEVSKYKDIPDFCAFNYYQSSYVKADNNGGVVDVPWKAGYERTAIGWPISPRGLYYGPKFYYERYKKPILITENGLSNCDWVSIDGKVHDPQRIDFLNRYLIELKKAVNDGVDVAGYFQWSLMDNFEWARGYNERFGLIYVNYQTQERILKDSAFWYKNVIKENGGNL